MQDNSMSEMSCIRGIVRGVRFRNEENGYTVMDLNSNDLAEESDQFNLLENIAFTAVGSLASVAVGESLELHGYWVEHPEYGMQFKILKSISIMPETKDGIERYLASGLIEGIGPKTASNIVRMFGENSFNVIENDPDLLATVKGIGKRRAKLISENFRAMNIARTTIIALQSIGISTNQALKLFQIYGPDALALIQENPYRLIDEVEGVGFARADTIAIKMGIPENSPKRIRASISFILQRAQSEGGHTCYPFKGLCELAAKLIGEEDISVLQNEVTQMVLESRVVTQYIDEVEMIFLPWLCSYEQYCARALLTLNREVIEIDQCDIEQQLTALERDSGITLDEEQRRAVLMAFERGVLVITGGPGTGKTTILNFILRLMDKMGMDVALCAPTGRAAKRLGETAGAEAATIHRLLGYSGERFERNRDNLLECDALIVDEMSMVDTWLFYHLLDALPIGTRLILVGDVDQLPSVGAGNVLGDIIESKALPVIRLKKIFRQGERSRIIENAHRINAGKIPILEYSEDFAFQQIYSPNDILRRIIGICTAGKLGDPWNEVQVMAPSRKGVIGVNALNKQLQAALNPPKRGVCEVTNGERTFRVGDKIMQTKNNYKIEWIKPGLLSKDLKGKGVFNGDMGTIMQIYPDERIIELLFDDERQAFYEFKMLDQIDLAYAISIHKSQGNEFPIVLMPLSDGPPMLHTRNLLYTAVTRARQNVVIIGRQSAIAYMIENAQERKRYTFLQQSLERLSEIY